MSEEFCWEKFFSEEPDLAAKVQKLLNESEGVAEICDELVTAFRAYRHWKRETGVSSPITQQYRHLMSDREEELRTLIDEHRNNNITHQHNHKGEH